MGFEVYVNGEKVWDSGGDYENVSSIVASTKNGAFGELGVSNNLDRLDLLIQVRDPDDSNRPLDLVDKEIIQGHANTLEKKSKKAVEADRKAMRAEEAAKAEAADQEVPEEKPTTEEKKTGSGSTSTGSSEKVPALNIK